MRRYFLLLLFFVFFNSFLSSQVYFEELYDDLNKPKVAETAITIPQKVGPENTVESNKITKKDSPILIAQYSDSSKKNKQGSNIFPHKQRSYIYMQIGLGYYGEVTLGSSSGSNSEASTLLLHGLLFDFNFLFGSRISKVNIVGFALNVFLGLPFLASGYQAATSAATTSQSGLDIRNFFVLGLAPGFFYQADPGKVFSFYLGITPLAPILKLQTNQLPGNVLDFDLDVGVALTLGFGFRFSRDKGIMFKFQSTLTYLEFLYKDSTDTGVVNDFSRSGYVHIHNSFTISFYLALKD